MLAVLLALLALPADTLDPQVRGVWVSTDSVVVEGPGTPSMIVARRLTVTDSTFAVLDVRETNDFEGNLAVVLEEVYDVNSNGLVLEGDGKTWHLEVEGDSLWADLEGGRHGFERAPGGTTVPDALLGVWEVWRDDTKVDDTKIGPSTVRAADGQVERAMAFGPLFLVSTSGFDPVPTDSTYLVFRYQVLSEDRVRMSIAEQAAEFRRADVDHLDG